MSVRVRAMYHVNIFLFKLKHLFGSSLITASLKYSVYFMLV